MKRTLNFLGWATLVGVLLSVALVIAAVSRTGAMDGATIEFNGDPWTLAELDTGHWLAAVGGIALALLVLALMLLALALIVPLAVLIPLAIAAVVLLGALLAVAGVLAIAFSPLILLVIAVWLLVRLIWRPTRRGGAKSTPVSGATIAG